jgi:hypothetical protein
MLKGILPKIRKAGPFWGTFLWAFGFNGVYTPWGIFLTPKYFNNRAAATPPRRLHPVLGQDLLVSGALRLLELALRGRGAQGHEPCRLTQNN